MGTPAVEGIDLFKIANRSMSFDLIHFAFPNHIISRLLAIGRLVEPPKVMYRFDGPAT